MIIWGSKGRQKIIGTGQFYCPRCKTKRLYNKVSIGKYFTLYFIPLFQTSQLGEFIECQTCFTPFEVSVLEYDFSAVEEMQKFLALIRDGTNRGVPINILYDNLINEMGLGENTANNIISMATQGKLKVCQYCRLIYSAELKFCSSCGKPLTRPE